jgi:cell division protein FtsW (lipid II flippase)
MKTVKRILCMLIIIVVMVLMSVSVVFAADSSPGTVDTPNEFMNWEYLGTMGGAVAATTLIVQFLKVPIDKVWKIPTRFIVYLIALITMLAAEYITHGGILLERGALIIFNAVIAAMASIGSYETIKRKKAPT